MTSADPAPTGTDRRIDRLLAAYGDNHQNLINKAVHWVCVPVITWCELAFLAALPFPDSLRIVPGVSWGLVAAIIGCDVHPLTNAAGVLPYLRKSFGASEVLKGIDLSVARGSMPVARRGA